MIEIDGGVSFSFAELVFVVEEFLQWRTEL